MHTPLQAIAKRVEQFSKSSNEGAMFVKGLLIVLAVVGAIAALAFLAR
jgi:hypothetical protein